MVASAHPLATQAGLRILKKGGNAIDAAVAVQFALAVVYPNAGNIGGGGFMIYRNQQGEHFALDYREMAPAAADKDMYLDAQGEVIPRLSLDGHLAAGVPGSVAGMVEAHHRFGKTAWKDLLQAAIDLAARGFTLTHQQAEGLNRYQEAFKKLNTHRPAFIKDSPWKAGDVLVQKELAATLRRIQAEGRAGFYEGTTADFIVAEMKAGNGIISHEDLKNYRAKWREPISFAYKDFQVVSMPPPSSGGIALAQLLKIIEDYPIASWGVHSVPSVHLMVEAERRVYADRASHLGDADFYPVPIETLLDKDYLKNRMADFNPDKATPSSEIIAGTIGKESEETTHFSIVDKQGNAVSITTTLNGSYGAKTVVSGAGFLLNNEMDDFSAKPGVPNLYGLVGAEANAIAPGKRMLSSMTPTIVSKDGDLYMVVGTPGGSTIITSVFQTFLNVAEFGMPVSEAVQAPRFHHQWLPDRLFVEEDCLSENTRAALENMGHHIKERASIGRVEAILLLPNGKLSGAADKRGDDSVGGF
ncbi:MAG TPA: gamma-glutamyltransferase [Phaeodactylibacter sp.]|nr:gamma-glutamyltransferase [Phaeodactylibacter sp.]